MIIDEVEKGHLLAQAGYRCEYCRKLLTDQTYQLDHIWPESREGLSVLPNLAISCQRCNNNKAAHVEWVDPLSGSTHPLFNPRSMKWETHFREAHTEVVGVSPTGNATAALLFRSTSQYLPPDLRWDKIGELYENQPIYYFLNHLRYRRLRNDFSILYKQLMGPLPAIEATEEQIRIARFAKNLLLLELYFTRSHISDVTSGISYGHTLLLDKALFPYERSELLGILSILYQQRATIHFDTRNIEAAKQDQNRAYAIYAKANPGSLEKSSISPETISTILRARTVSQKYDKIDTSATAIDTFLKSIEDLDAFYATSHYSYLVDLILLNPSPPTRALEHLYEKISTILDSEGYGTNIDQARLITLRRRWWVLHFMLEERTQNETLLADLDFWKNIMMFNEIRELEGYVKRIKNHIPSGRIQELLGAICEV